ncbi:hypothetical protein AB5L52_45315 (plasmid) [Streptomyces sp. CG4]|uniref:hypothetical protein n=1 Tax=Streptomyces sp. CG4 TaxID=408783 RepID=UPI0034E27520
MSELYRFIHAEKANYPVTLLCRVLHVARSSYYAWREGEAARRRRQAADDALAQPPTTHSRTRSPCCTSPPAVPTVSRVSTPSCAASGGG